MSRILFATYEFHPTTWGGCGVLLRHATDLLLSQGHEVDLLLDLPKSYFDRFVARDQATLSVPDRCRAHHVDALCEDLAWSVEEIENSFIWKSLRFAHALRRLSNEASIDFVEFFEYCGVGYHALVEKRFGLQPARPILGLRVHNSVELIDLHEGTKGVDRDRAILYGLERAALAHSEATLLPSKSYADRYYVDRYSLPDDAIEISEPPTVRFGKRPQGPLESRREIQFFGRIFEFKGIECFVRAALLVLESRPDLDFDFVLIGNDSREGPGGKSYTEYLRGTVPARFADRFVFTGHLGHAEVLERFGRARFAVFPNRFESFCYAAHEVYEAGVPMLVSDIPAFRNYLDEGKKAYYFDGSSIDLARQMMRLIDQPELLERLECGGRLAENPLGQFYEAPRALRPIPQDARESIGIATVVLVPERASDAHLQRTLDSIRPQLDQDDVILLAYDEGDPRGAAQATSIRWLGATRRLQTLTGEPLALSQFKTREALWLLLAGDEPSPDFVSLCRGALARNPSLAFAGTWMRDADGNLVESMIDIAPDRYPFDAGARLTRVLQRTRTDGLLIEVFEAQAGIYGEIGALWRAEEERGRGCLLARALLQASPIEAPAADAGQLAFLVQAVASPMRRERLALMTLDPTFGKASLGTDIEAARSRRLNGVDFDQARRVALTHLDGTTLARLAGQKLRRKVGAILARLMSRSPGRRDR